MPAESSQPKNNRTLIIVIVVVVLACLLCLCVLLVAAAIYEYPRLTGSQVNGPQPFPFSTNATPTPLVPGAGNAPSTSGATPGYDQATQFAGKWDGTWNNTTYATTGNVHATIAVQPDGTATIQLAISGNVFGIGNFPSVTYPGTYDASGFTFTQSGDPFFGNLKITIRYSGEVAMSGDALTIPGFLKVSATGSMAKGKGSLNYSVSFSNGTLAKGNASLTQTP
jgi:hypothetical protein